MESFLDSNNPVLPVDLAPPPSATMPPRPSKNHCGGRRHSTQDARGIILLHSKLDDSSTHGIRFRSQRVWLFVVPDKSIKSRPSFSPPTLSLFTTGQTLVLRIVT